MSCAEIEGAWRPGRPIAHTEAGARLSSVYLSDGQTGTPCCFTAPQGAAPRLFPSIFFRKNRGTYTIGHIE